LQRARESIEYDAIAEPDFQSLEVDDAHVTLLRWRWRACSRNRSKLRG
jgi:hypothetical protein